MGIRTEIEWADSTVNPTTGCEGCELWNKRAGARHCYAGTLHEGRLAKSLPGLYAAEFEEVRLAPGRMAAAARWGDLSGKPHPGKPRLDGKPRMIFVGDMGDIFSKAVPFEYLRDEVIGAVVSPEGRRHIWMLLTKQAARAVEFARWLSEECATPWPVNAWPGVSVTSRRTISRAEIMAYHPAATRFISAEPLLGPVEFSRGLILNYRLLICGGESGPGARPIHPAWARSLRDQCAAAGVSFHYKQNGEYIHESQIPADFYRDRESRNVKEHLWPDGSRSFRVGKHAAGRRLDGHNHDEFPTPEASRA